MPSYRMVTKDRHIYLRSSSFHLSPGDLVCFQVPGRSHSEKLKLKVKGVVLGEVADGNARWNINYRFSAPGRHRRTEVVGGYIFEYDRELQKDFKFVGISTDLLYEYVTSSFWEAEDRLRELYNLEFFKRAERALQ